MTEHFDVVIIGGGIHGVGVAQAAVCAGYSALVLEKTALASGSSSRSSKLIHGGLRYLEGPDFSLVRESLQERALLLKIAPDLVRLQPFHIPVYGDTSRRPLMIRSGLSLYALLAGFGPSGRFRKLRRAEWSRLDGLATTGLQCVYRYYDAQTNDVRLTQAVMQSALELGARLYCPAEFLAAEIAPDGCRIRYRRNGHLTSCRAGALVNAAGPWINHIADRIHPANGRIDIDLVQGTHLVLEGRLESGCYYLEVPADRRAVFLLPWGDHTLLGTTEHLYTGDPADVAPLDAEEAYLLEVMRHYFPQRPQRVLERYAGLRVLPGSGPAAFHRSRETSLQTDDPRRPRLVWVYGGKLTGYRATGHKVMRLLRRTLPARKTVARTSQLRLKPV
ncbi:MAG: FAD-dependent oxidoreductase [Gammaproteobacteria bacterium]|jgi:glycerol-3-phosphate dehydrogenase